VTGYIKGQLGWRELLAQLVFQAELDHPHGVSPPPHQAVADLGCQLHCIRGIRAAVLRCGREDEDCIPGTLRLGRGGDERDGCE
jgi:hypothetical protein